MVSSRSGLETSWSSGVTNEQNNDALGQSEAAVQKKEGRRDKQERRKNMEKYCGLGHDTWTSRGQVIVMGEP